MPSRLQSYLDRFAEVIQQEYYNQKIIFRNFILPEVQRKRVTFPEFRRKLVFSWHQFKKKCTRKPYTQEFHKFFLRKFPELYAYFASRLLPFDVTRLSCIAKNYVTNDEILFEYKYLLSPVEMEDVHQFRVKNNYPEKEEKIVSYMFDIMTTAFGILSHQFIDIDINISQACGIIRGFPPNQSFHFLVSVRKSQSHILEKYFQAEFYRFCDNFPFIPAVKKKEMSSFVTNLLQVARQEYDQAEKTLAGVIYHFYRRCSTLQLVTPLLDFFTYVGSRTEDSKYTLSKILSQDLLKKFNYRPEKTAAITRLFGFVQKVSTLLTTFQSKNGPEPKKQVELFLVYCQYYFQRGLTRLRESKEIIYFPELFNRCFSDAINSGVLAVDMPTRFIHLILLLYAIVPNPAAPRFIKLIFRQSAFSINESFFESYSKELNSHFLDLITGEDVKLRPLGEKLSFNLIIDLLCRFLFVLIKKIFLRKTPEEATENFPETRSRYSGPQIALNVLETELFREIPMSDAVWGNYLISLRSDLVKEKFAREYNITLPDSLFFDSSRINRMGMIYANGLEEGTPPLSEWLVNELLVPFAQFEKTAGGPFEIGTEDSLSRFQKYFADNARDPEERGGLLEILDILHSMWPSISL